MRLLLLSVAKEANNCSSSSFSEVKNRLYVSIYAFCCEDHNFHNSVLVYRRKQYRAASQYLLPCTARKGNDILLLLFKLYFKTRHKL